jgi:maltose-binding protein MalE
MSPLRLAAATVCFPSLSCGKKQQKDGITHSRCITGWKRIGCGKKRSSSLEESHRHPVVLQTSPYAVCHQEPHVSPGNGCGPDVAEDWFGQELIHKNYALNLMGYVNRDLVVDEFNSETFTEWRGVAQREDELFGFPACLGLTVLFYNQDLFDRAGIPYPDTSWTTMICAGSVN